MSFVVLTIEAAFECNNVTSLQDAVREALETLRGQGTARVIASKTVPTDPFENPEWRAKALTFITIQAPVEIEVD